MKHECGLCGEKDFDKLQGPYAGGPFDFYCKKCRLIIDDYYDSGFCHKRNSALLEKYLLALAKHKMFIKGIIQDVKISEGMKMCFGSEKTDGAEK